MLRANTIILVLSLGLILPGCATLEYLDGSTEDEQDAFRMSKDEMYTELKRQKARNARLKRQIDTLKMQEKQLPQAVDKNEITKARDENKSLVQEMGKLREDLQSLSAENERLEKMMAGIQVKEEPPPPVLHKVKKDIGRLKIKVLSGDGNLNSAKRMAKQLGDMGYRVQMIDRAPRATFRTSVIFYAANVVDEARRLHTDLGYNPILKPLTWSSRFDIILVTGSSQ